MLYSVTERGWGGVGWGGGDCQINNCAIWHFIEVRYVAITRHELFHFRTGEVPPGIQTGYSDHRKLQGKHGKDFSFSNYITTYNMFWKCDLFEFETILNICNMLTFLKNSFGCQQSFCT